MTLPILSYLPFHPSVFGDQNRPPRIDDVEWVDLLVKVDENYILIFFKKNLEEWIMNNLFFFFFSFSRWLEKQHSKMELHFSIIGPCCWQFYFKIQKLLWRILPRFVVKSLFCWFVDGLLTFFNFKKKKKIDHEMSFPFWSCFSSCQFFLRN